MIVLQVWLTGVAGCIILGIIGLALLFLLDEGEYKYPARLIVMAPAWPAIIFWALGYAVLWLWDEAFGDG